METKNYPEEIDFQKYWLVLKRRWLVTAGIFVVFAGFAGFKVSTQKTSYEATGQLLFQGNRASSLTGVGEKIGDLESIKRESNPLDTQAAIMQSFPIREEVINNLKQEYQQAAGLNAEKLLLEIKSVIGTDVLNVSYTSEDPELAKAVVDQVMKSYIRNNIMSNRAEALSAGKFIQKEFPRVQAALDKAAEELRLFKTKNQIIDLEEETDYTVKTLAELDDEINKAKSQLAALTAQSAEIRRQANVGSNQAVEVTSLNQIPGVQEVLSELQKVQTQIVTEKRYTDAHPEMINLRNQEAALNSLLQKRTSQVLGSKVKIASGKLQVGTLKQNLVSEFVELESQRLGYEKRVETLSNLQAAYKQRANKLPILEKKQGELTRRLSLAQKSYENLSNTLQQIKVAESQTVGNARVIQPAVLGESKAAFKKTLLLAFGSVFSGLLLGVAGAFFVDIFDRRLKSVKEAESVFGFTLLGLIPKYETNNASAPKDSSLEEVSPRVIVTTSPRSVIHENYQMLQANLKFISDKKVRTIVVTSSVPGEGKSEISANLAAVLAQTGRRVLLIDADMRKPSQHHLWGLINSVGLSNVIVGQDEFTTAVQQITSNLSVLTAGVIPPNPLGLIDSERLPSLIQLFSKSYDYIIFDTPPLVGTPDAAVLGKMADGVLLVVRPGVVDSASAAAAKSLLARSEANILGLVANGVNVKQEPDSYFYYNTTRYGHSVEKVNAMR